MILIVTALMAEAAPIIEHFRLKKDMDAHAFQVFRNDEIKLVISGVGKVKSAMAAAWLLASCGRDAFLVNVGCCGIAGKEFEAGRLFMVHKVTDMDTGLDYYPDVFAGRDIPRTAICCYSKPVSCGAGVLADRTAVDMESAGIMEAAGKFLDAHRVVILKIASDPLSPGRLNKATLSGYVRGNIARIERVIDELWALGGSCGGRVSGCALEMIETLASNLRLTRSMKDALVKAVEGSTASGGEPVPILESFRGLTAKTKNEGKAILGRIIAKLNGRNV